MLRAAAGSLPFIPRGETLPTRTLTVDDLPIDRSNVAAITAASFVTSAPTLAAIAAMPEVNSRATVRASACA